MKNNIYRKDLKQKAQMLRKNMTDEERHLWYDFLRQYELNFRRQKPIGNYIVDFYCGKARLVVEIDGGQHYDEAAIVYDKKRTEYLNNQGLFVLRFTNREIHENFREVCEHIDNEVKRLVTGRIVES
ncbi:MAG: endonuclease domain-containing protein [Anaerovibrio sp.]|uniref:endonuclease domain-containing protein n=1 Tax=Anaerovibrio sp. TaxID=1872532 RepID=UPI0025FC336D|nr:endonuclease domain-containing protein [Anaerovibrio sp.]MCR5175984.1 endonuclease domain-containing protein [Anaerovibrio sp.]